MTITRIKKVLIILLFCSTSRLLYAGTEVLDQFYANTRSMQADFQQTVSERFGKVLEKSSGSLIIQRPHQFVLNYQAPDQQQYVSNGKKLWIYDLELEQVTIKGFDDGLADSPALLISSNQNIHKSYRVSEAHDPQRPQLQIFRLQPKQEESLFAQVYLTFQQGKLIELTMQDNFEQVTKLVLNNIRLNEKIPAQTFTLQIPEDVDVIGTLNNNGL